MQDWLVWAVQVILIFTHCILQSLHRIVWKTDASCEGRVSRLKHLVVLRSEPRTYINLWGYNSRRPEVNKGMFFCCKEWLFELLITDYPARCYYAQNRRSHNVFRFHAILWKLQRLLCVIFPAFPMSQRSHFSTIFMSDIKICIWMFFLFVCLLHCSAAWLAD